MLMPILAQNIDVIILYGTSCLCFSQFQVKILFERVAASFFGYNKTAFIFKNQGLVETKTKVCGTLIYLIL